MTDRIVINPQLIAAIEHYSTGSYDPLRPSMFVFKDKNGHQTAWPLERACGVAYEVLSREDLCFLKLKVLKKGLKKYGMEKLYAAIMGEPIDASDD